MSNHPDNQNHESKTDPVPQKVHFVKPRKKLNEMTDVELREYAKGLGEALKQKQQDPIQADQEL